MPNPIDIRRKGLICLLLSALTLAAYWPIQGYGFINFDDPYYVVKNDRVLHGLEWENVKWAFTSTYAANWHPLTWFSHMLDAQIFGKNPAGHHWMNVFFHTVNSLLVFLMLSGMTGAPGRSTMVAALFALHPLHVESVAWISERKDVLSTFFGLLALWAYARHAQVIRPLPWQFLRSKFYWFAFASFAFGLMSKPMLVTWPCLMAVLDFWPLQRLGPPKSAISRKVLFALLLEKMPLLALTVGSCVITCVAQTDAMRPVAFGTRIQNAIISYGGYLQHVIRPEDLCIFYPYPNSIDNKKLLFASIAIIVITLTAWRLARTRAYLLTGWLWYLGTLVPVIGLLQVGGQAMADRYMYFPVIGIFIAVVWGVSDVVARWRYSRLVLVGTAVPILVVCLMLTRVQLQHWRNGEIVFRHAIAVTSDNWGAHLNLGGALLAQEKYADAEEQFEIAHRLAPDSHLTKIAMGLRSLRRNELTNAIQFFRSAIEMEPHFDVSHLHLADALESNGEHEAAVGELRAVLKINPESKEALNNLAWTLATTSEEHLRNGIEAVQFGERLCQLTKYREPQFVGTLAAAYAEAGRFEDAVTTAERARQIALAHDVKDLAQRNAELADLYRAHKVYHEP